MFAQVEHFQIPETSEQESYRLRHAEEFRKKMIAPRGCTHDNSRDRIA